MEIERLLKMQAKDDIDMLCMILSNNIDYGGTNGGMISVKKFQKCAEDIILWHKTKINNLNIEESFCENHGVNIRTIEAISICIYCGKQII